MRLIHCADIHLDSGLLANLSAEKAHQRREEILHTFLRMIQYADEQRVDAILISGDLFDSAHVSQHTRNTVLQSAASHPDISFFVLNGNHDGVVFENFADEVPDNWHNFDGDSVWTRYDCGRVSIYGSVQCGQTGLRIPGPHTDPSQINLVMAHGQISEYPSVDPQHPVICLRDFRGMHVDYLALGHVHQFQKGSLDSSGVWCYPGCLEGRGFDECGEHGFVLLDIEEDTHRIDAVFIPFADRRIIECTVDVSRCENSYQILSEIRQGLMTMTEEKRPSERDLVKVILSGSYDIMCEKNPGFIAEELRREYYQVRVEDRTGIAVSYASLASDASLKGEFIREILNDQTLAEELKAKIIRCGIQALGLEEIVL